MTFNLWEEEEQLNMRDLIKRSMESPEIIASNRELREKTTSHFNMLLEQRESKGNKQDDKAALKLMGRLFAETSKTMESDADRERLVILKDYVSCLIGTTLGVDEFLPEFIPKDEQEDEEDEEIVQVMTTRTASWADVAARKTEDESTVVQRRAWCRQFEYGVAAERREHVRVQQMARQYYQQQDQDPEDWGCFEPQFLDDVPGEFFCMPIFFPSESSYHTFITALRSAQETLHICVFSMTDNTTARAIADAQRRGVDVKIITDNEQMDSKGSDVVRLGEEEGVPYKMDNG
ncbi:hypothetical protein BX666DRAFT_1882885 [Dichotomocladium elegans]|nr:hypothetical protein BX666DRAFT_1882885 [Dichotomocladium elegans]